ncbi:hypothetical protein KIPB_011924, partial [Kipferlia bialata]|eukprot:g11924.t1
MSGDCTSCAYVPGPADRECYRALEHVLNHLGGYTDGCGTDAERHETDRAHGDMGRGVQGVVTLCDQYRLAHTQREREEERKRERGGGQPSVLVPVLIAAIHNW